MNREIKYKGARFYYEVEGKEYYVTQANEKLNEWDVYSKVLIAKGITATMPDMALQIVLNRENDVTLEWSEAQRALLGSNPPGIGPP